MNAFMIERDMPGIGAAGDADLAAAAVTSNAALAQLAPRVQWQHSYVTGDRTYCVYLAEDEDAIREHARISGFPASRITRGRPPAGRTRAEPPARGAAAQRAFLRFLAHFHNVLIYVLIGAAVVTAALQHWVDTGVILAVVIVNAVIGFVQEGRAEQAMEAIRDMLAPRGGCCATAGAGASMRPSWCRATSCSSRRATGCPPTCG
jgi:hypothetical protein